VLENTARRAYASSAMTELGQGIVFVLFLALIWYLPSHLVARWVSRSKGRSFGWFLVLGLAFGWLISLIVGLIVSDRRPPAPGTGPHQAP
jgi:heme/copper-type cytochrome/quinol oxidase subunit 1